MKFAVPFYQIFLALCVIGIPDCFILGNICGVGFCCVFQGAFQFGIARSACDAGDIFRDFLGQIGLALENFDAVGQFRTMDGPAAVDPSGTLVDGTTFDGPAAFRKALLTRGDAYRSVLTRKLLTYAMGRGVETYDMPTVRQILRDANKDDYRWSTILMGIVKSRPFQMKKAQA